MLRPRTATISVFATALATFAAATPALAEQDVSVNVSNSTFSRDRQAVDVEFSATLNSKQSLGVTGWYDDVKDFGDCSRDGGIIYTLPVQGRMHLCAFTLRGAAPLVSKEAELKFEGAYLHPNGDKEAWSGTVYLDNTTINFAVWSPGRALDVTRTAISGYQHKVNVRIAAPPTRVTAPALELQALREAPCTITGTDGDDLIIGTDGDDVICAGAGDDIVLGLDGDDIIRGGKGNDTIDGGKGDDVLGGGAGGDYLIGGEGDDIAHGATGEDLLDGGEGDDRLYGGSGDDAMLADAERTIVVQDSARWITTDDGDNVLEDHDGQTPAWADAVERQLPSMPSGVSSSVTNICDPYNDSYCWVIPPRGIVRGPVVTERPEDRGSTFLGAAKTDEELRREIWCQVPLPGPKGGSICGSA